MTQGKRSKRMIKGGMSDLTAVRRILNPSLRGRQFPKIEMGQIYKYRNGTELKILKPKNKKEIWWEAEVIKGKKLGHIGKIHYNSLFTEWELI